MYLRKIERHYKDRVYLHYLLVESVHTPRGPRQKTICSLGDLKPKPALEWLELFQDAVEALTRATKSVAPATGRQFLRGA